MNTHSNRTRANQCAECGATIPREHTTCEQAYGEPCTITSYQFHCPDCNTVNTVDMDNIEMHSSEDGYLFFYECQQCGWEYKYPDDEKEHGIQTTARRKGVQAAADSILRKPVNPVVPVDRRLDSWFAAGE